MLITTMLFGQARYFAFILTFLLGSALSAPCALSTDIAGLGKELKFSSATTKLSVLGFSAIVTYVTLPPGKSSVVSSHIAST
jgi:hypothetical protein